MLLIALGHKSKRGKDTLAIYLMNRFCDISDIQERRQPLRIRKYGFGDELKIEINEAVAAMAQTIVNDGYELDPYDKHQVMRALCAKHNVMFDPNPPMNDPLCPFGKQRYLLQWWGTEYRRAQNPDYWVAKLFQRLQSEQPAVALITDLRFPNEFEAVRDAGGFCIRLDRPGYVDDPVTAAHYSENALNDHVFDYVIRAETVEQLLDVGHGLFYRLMRMRRYQWQFPNLKGKYGK